MEIGSEIDGFQVQKSRRPRSLAGVTKEAIQRHRVAKAMWVCTDENTGMPGELEPWVKAWGCVGYSMSGTKVWECVGMHSHAQPWTDGVDKGQGQGLMTSEFKCGTKVPGISEILWK